MILLVGGTSETAPLATALSEAGFRVLVSTATQVPLDVGSHPNIQRRSGELNRDAMAKLAQEHGIRLIVDASHPYASNVRLNAKSVAAELDLPYVSWVRPPAAPAEDFVRVAPDHESAASLACSFGKPILLTIGTRNLGPYVAAATRAHVMLVARILPHEDSLHAAAVAGIPQERIVAGRGPFPLEENLSTIKRFNIGCVVTKDSGEAGGVPAKIEAARQAGCKVVMVARPKDASEATFSNPDDVVREVKARLR
jgi:precorrin-6A/cobalt-precorrin-6A reductase